MFNYNSPIVQNMINSGQFGTQTPLQLSAYNPYEQYGNPYAQQYNNIIPIGQKIILVSSYFFCKQK